jgi:hypothetical protein
VNQTHEPHLLREPYLTLPAPVRTCPRCNGAFNSVLHLEHCCACRETTNAAGEPIRLYCWHHAPDVLAPNERIECTCGRSWLKSTQVFACRECRAEDYDATLGGMGR